VTFEEKANYWRKRWQKKVEWACGEITEKVEKSWRGVYEKGVEEEVDRRMKRGKLRGKDKVETKEVGRREKGKERGERGEPRLRKRTRL